MAYRETAATRAARRRREEALVDAALRIVARSGFAAAGVHAVATEARVAAGTVYTYFPGKSQLLAAVFDRMAEIELNAVRTAVRHASPDRTDVPAADRLARLISVFARRALRARRLAWSLLFEPVDPAIDAERLAFRRSYAQTIGEIVQDGIESGEFAEQDVPLVATALVGAIGEALVGPLSPLGPSRVDDGGAPSVVIAITRFCLSALGLAAPGSTALDSTTPDSTALLAHTIPTLEVRPR
jgi:AcrR family transcriptional regulator